MKNRLTNLLGISVVLAALPLACAQTAAAPAKPPASVTTVKPAAAKPGVSGVVVFKDPVTGQIRQPEASEIGELLQGDSSAARTSTESTLQVIQGPGNMLSIKLDDSFMTSVVMTKGVDGKLTMECVEGAKNATEGVKAVKPAAKKEVLDEK